MPELRQQVALFSLTHAQVRSLARQLQGDMDDSEGLLFWMEGDTLVIGATVWPEQVRIEPSGEIVDE